MAVEKRENSRRLVAVVINFAFARTSILIGLLSRLSFFCFSLQIAKIEGFH